MYNALTPASVLLPKTGIDLTRWAVIACDQFTSQPEYWENARRIVAGAPSTLNMILPEAWLAEAGARTGAIQQAMADALRDGTVTEAVQGAVLVERETASGRRIGLVVALDLEEYEYGEGSHSLIRPTEQTVPERVPPRAAIRSGAPLELPHVMMLIDDPAATVIEPLYEHRDALRGLYDFELMLGGGHLRGWAVEGEAFHRVDGALEKLADISDGLLYAVGDGNHSLAAAKLCWQEKRAGLSEEERRTHPARWALVELVNLHCPALKFEPIHRLLTNVDMEELLADLEREMLTRKIGIREGDDAVFFQRGKRIGYRFDDYPLPFLQDLLDRWLKGHPEAAIDYIHDDDALEALVKADQTAVGLLVRGFEKQELFPTIRQHGRLPRKAFSMGVSSEKRYYMEARRIEE